jgi:hypothetical protein
MTTAQLKVFQAFHPSKNLFVILVFLFITNFSFSQCACIYYNSAGEYSCILYDNCSGPNLSACAGLTTASPTPRLCGPGNPCPQHPDMNGTCGGCQANGACWYNGNSCSASVACSLIQVIITLPVELVDLKGFMSGLGNEITWSTQSEWNSSHFDILHSIDGINFNVLYSISSVGNSTELQRYSFTHVDYSENNINYYKLKQVDVDGAHKEYPPISIDNRDHKFDGLFSDFYPNPSDHYMYFQYGGADFTNPVVVEVMNTLGEKVMVYEVTEFNKYQGIPLDATVLSSGMYTARIKQGENFETKKIVVAH